MRHFLRIEWVVHSSGTTGLSKPNNNLQSPQSQWLHFCTIPRNGIPPAFLVSLVHTALTQNNLFDFISYSQVCKSPRNIFYLSSLYFLWHFIFKHTYFMFFSQNKTHFRNNKKYIKLLFLVFITQARKSQLPTS